MDPKKLKQEVTTVFKLNGFSIRRESSVLLAEYIIANEISEYNKWIDKIIGCIRNQQLTSPIIEKEHIELAIKDCSRNGLEDSETILNVINVFDIPKFNYNVERKKFFKDNDLSSKIELYSEPKWKAQFLIDRYTMILQRIKRNKLFTSETLPGSAKEKVFGLKYVENLLSSSSRIDEVIVLGLLTQLTEGTYYLEDLTGSVPLDLTNTRFHSGLITEYCFILAEGYYEDKMFHVMGLVMPPSEPRNLSQIYYGNVNTFGGKSKTSLKNSENLIKIEKDNEDGMIIFLSDVWFDSIQVMDKLKSLLSGYDQFPPVAIVFIGEFLSCPYGFEQSSHLKNALKAFGDLVSQYTTLLESCKLIFVPGRSDPSCSNILPRPPIPDALTEDIRSKLGDKVIFTSNPCRIQYCTQEIVVFRQDLVTKMCRNTIHFPESGDIPDHLTKTLLSQCTLSPLSIGIQPLYWQHVDALNLYPTPDLVVIADHFQPYTRSSQNCQFINPGSFPRTEFSFKVYMPSTRTVEDSQIPNED